MKWQIKLYLFVSLGLLAVMGAFLVEKYLLDQRLTENVSKQFITTQAQTVEVVLRDRLGDLSGRILKAFQGEVSDEDLLMVTRFQLTEQNDWRSEQSRVLSPQLKTWPETYFEDLYRTLPLSEVQGPQKIFGVLRDPAGRPVFMVIFETGPGAVTAAGTSAANAQSRGLALALVQGNYFADLLLPYKGGFQQWMLVNEQGTLLAHPRREWIGTKGGDQFALPENLTSRSELPALKYT